VGIEKESSKKSSWVLSVAAAAVVLGALAFLGERNYLTFHTLAELFSITVAAAVFVIVWNVRDTIDNGYLHFLGIALLFVASIDLAHMLAFKGMGVFPGYGTDLPTQLWIAGRALESVSLLIAPVFLARRLRSVTAFASYTVITVLVLLSAFRWKIFPACYIEGYGLTPFKISAEYAICFILVLALLGLLANRRSFRNTILMLLCGSILTMILSEFAFTQYASVYGNFNLIGHLLKIISVVFIYKAIVETGFRRPYELLYRSLAESEQRFRLFIEHAPAALAMLDREMHYVSVSNQWLSDYKLEGRNILGLSHYEIFPEIPESWREILHRGLAGEVIRVEEDLFLRADGSTQWLQWEVRPWHNAAGQISGIVIFTKDITERKRAEEQLRKAHDGLEQMVHERTKELREANRTLRMITECNEVLVRAREEQALMRDICRIIVEVGGYRMAWVGYAEDNDEKTVCPVAFQGFEEGYLKNARISWADNERGSGPTGTCVRTGEICFGRNFLEDRELAPWREDALKRGFRSSIALPLKSEAKAFGAITIYSQDAYAFDMERDLLRELADDLAFGIRSIRIQAERDHALQMAEKRAGQLQALAAELVQTEQKERRQLARILHDHLQQLLVAAKIGASVIRRKAEAKDVQEMADRVIETLDESIQTSRSLTANLSPPVLHEKGLAAGLEWLRRQMLDKHGLRLEVKADSDAEPGAEQVRIFLFEAVRELLLNTVKHAKVDFAQIRVRMLESGEIELVVADEGAGFDPAQVEAAHSTTGGFGLFSIRERLSYLGGHMHINAAPGQGSRFTLVAPVRLASQSSATEQP
jgi:PAS domain S-box-containing protein